MQDETKPSDAVAVSQLPAFIRANRAEMNDLITTLVMATGTTTLVVGTSVQDIDIEVILLTAGGACTLATMTGGRTGQIKIFVIGDANVKFTDGITRTLGRFWLNQTAGTDFTAAVDDILAVVNVGGDGDSTPGYWKELWRTIDTK